MGRKLQGAALLAAMSATMVGTMGTDAAQARPKSQAKQIHQLQRQVKALSHRVKAMGNDMDDMTASINLSLGLLACFTVQGAGVQPAAAFGDPTTSLEAFADDPSTSPMMWFALVDPSCVNTGGPAAARARVFRGYFGVNR